MTFSTNSRFAVRDDETLVCQLALPVPALSIPQVRYYDGQGNGTLASIPPCTTRPSGFQNLNGLVSPAANRADSYSSRVRGWIKPVVSGLYTFFITSDDAGSFALGLADGTQNPTLVPQISNAAYSGPPGSGGASFQTTLTAGSAYPFEVLQSEGGGGDYFQVDWSGPVGARQVVPASVLTAENPNLLSKRSLTKRTVGNVVTYYDANGGVVVPSAAEPLVDCALNTDYGCAPNISSTYLGPSGYYNGNAISQVQFENFAVRYDQTSARFQITCVAGTETINYYSDITQGPTGATGTSTVVTGQALTAGVWVTFGGAPVSGSHRELLFTPSSASDGRGYIFESAYWSSPSEKMMMALRRWG